VGRELDGLVPEADVRFQPLRLPRGASPRARAEALPPLFADEARPRVLLGHGLAGAVLLDLAAFHAEAMDGVIVHAPRLGPRGARFFLPEPTPSWLASLPVIVVPAAVLWGERDPTFSTARLAALRRILPGAVVSLPGRWGRRPMLDDPAGYAREVAALARKLVAQ
jgi:pimeloyl-ACP methyl ester carboxylesterase